MPQTAGWKPRTPRRENRVRRRYLFACNLHFNTAPGTPLLSLCLRARGSTHVSGKKGGKGFSFLSCLHFLKTLQHSLSHWILARGRRKERGREEEVCVLAGSPSSSSRSSGPEGATPHGYSASEAAEAAPGARGAGPHCRAAPSPGPEQTSSTVMRRSHHFEQGLQRATVHGPCRELSV